MFGKKATARSAFLCPHCNTGLTAPMTAVGMLALCPCCRKDIEVKFVMLDDGSGDTGSAMKFSDFMRLLSPPLPDPVKDLVEKWCACEIQIRSGRPVMVSQSGRLLIPEFVHLDIQSNPQRQSELYQLAMSLWR